jgi:O-antigen ligase
MGENCMLRKNKNQLPFLYIIYLYSTIPFSIIYFTDLAKNVSIFFAVLNLMLKIIITTGACYYIYKDFHTKQYIRNNSNSKLFFMFFLFCIIASIINGNGFQKFNNIYFVIHSALFFFLALQNNHFEENYIKLINFIILIIISAISAISLITIIMFLSNKFNITESFNSQTLKEYFYFCAPVNLRWYTILSNPNTFGHLVSMSFILAIIPLVKLKKIKHKVAIVIMQILSFIALIFSGSKGAIFALGIGLLIGFIVSLILIYKNNHKKTFYTIIGSIFILIILTTIFISHSQNPAIINLIHYINYNIIRINTLLDFTNRAGLWECLLDLPLWSKPFGYSDNFIYHYMEAIQVHDYDVFLNNTGRSHNIYLQMLVSFGSIGFVIFISCLIKTFIQVLKNYKKINEDNKLLYYIFLIQFIVILAGGMVEQLPIFNMSAHSLLFMFVWANLLSLTEKNNE